MGEGMRIVRTMMPNVRVFLKVRVLKLYVFGIERYILTWKVYWIQFFYPLTPRCARTSPTRGEVKGGLSFLTSPLVGEVDPKGRVRGQEELTAYPTGHGF